jgi:hypothetical protein
MDTRNDQLDAKFNSADTPPRDGVLEYYSALHMKMNTRIFRPLFSITILPNLVVWAERVPRPVMHCHPPPTHKPAQ